MQKKLYLLLVRVCLKKKNTFVKILTLVKQKSDVSADGTEGNGALLLLEEDKFFRNSVQISL